MHRTKPDFKVTILGIWNFLINVNEMNAGWIHPAGGVAIRVWRVWMLLVIIDRLFMTFVYSSSTYLLVYHPLTIEEFRSKILQAKGKSEQEKRKPR